MTRRDEQRRHAVVALSMAASGFAGLAYQIIWTQQCSLWLGHESAAVLAVVSAFFVGLGLGGLLLGKRIEMSATPRRWYVASELVIAAWSLLLLKIWPAFGVLAQTATGVHPSAPRQWLVAFVGTSLLLLPATAAMGATLPAMERLTKAEPLAAGGSGERSISVLYAANTFGAVLGVLASTFWLIPSFGLAQSSVVSAGFNILCAALVGVSFPASGYPERSEGLAPPRVAKVVRSGVSWRLALTGVLGIGFEILVVRVLSQVTENTVYTFALLLAVYLVGTATGAWLYRRWLEGRFEVEATSDTLLVAVTAACLAGTCSLWAAQALRDAWLANFGSSIGAALGAEVVLALAAFGLPTVVMGALFSHLCRVALATGATLGRAAGVNVLAGAVAPALFGVIAVPWLGAKGALLCISCSYLAALTPAAWSKAKTWAFVGGVVALGALTPPLRFVDVPEGGRLVAYDEGVMAAVSIVEAVDGASHLRINNRQQEGSSVTRYVDARQAWLPLLIHPAPRRALFLGIGTGVTASAGSEYPELEVDAVELLPEVIEASAHFSPLTRRGNSGRVHVIAADARRYVRTTETKYDVVVADNFHPARSGSGSLYTVEHFRAIQARLGPSGLFCQWLPLHQLDLVTLGSIVASFVEVYPEAAAILASNSLETPVLGLLAGEGARRVTYPELSTRLASRDLAPLLAGLNFEDEYAIWGSFVAGPRALKRFAAASVLNTDDRPFVTYRAPLVTYAPTSSPSDRLLTLVGEWSLEVNEIFEPPYEREWSERLTAYWAARGRYLQSGRNVRPAARVEDMLVQVRGPLLDVLRLSPDFRPAYDPLFMMAKALARKDPGEARHLLADLSRLQPARDEAPELLTLLNGGPAAVRPNVGP